MRSILPERYMLAQLEAGKEKYLPKPEHLLSERNVRDEYKLLSTEDIRVRVARDRIPFAFLMVNVVLDYNLSTLVRLANAFGGEVFYYGQKRYDKRGTTGTHLYTPVHHLSSIGEVKALKRIFEFVALEQTDSSTELSKFSWAIEVPSLIVLGSESHGLQEAPEFMALIDQFVEIKQRGSVRSLNVGTAAAIAAYDFANKGKFL